VRGEKRRGWGRGRKRTSGRELMCPKVPIKGREELRGSIGEALSGGTETKRVGGAGKNATGLGF